jgi:hypothetical protein
MSMRSLPPEIGRYARIWWVSSTFWLVGFFVLGALGIGLPALIASGLVESATLTKGIAIAASVISGLQTFLKCDSRADRLHVAYRYLKTATFRFEHEDNYPISEVINAYEKGEQSIESAFAPSDSASDNQPPRNSN